MKLSLGLVLLSAATLGAQVVTSRPAVPAAAVPESVDAALVPNYVVVRPGLAAAGRPTDEGLRQLKALGFRTVVDLRAASEDGQPAEKALVEAQGLRYLHVPVTPATFSAADVDAVQAVLSAADAGPVLLHCASANRVGALWAVLQARDGVPIEEALVDGQRVGLRSASMTEAARRVARGAPPAEGPKVPRP
jgi:uncharacterized protein (TIGR01244 family)